MSIILPVKLLKNYYSHFDKWDTYILGKEKKNPCIKKKVDSIISHHGNEILSHDYRWENPELLELQPRSSVDALPSETGEKLWWKNNWEIALKII